MVYDSNAKVYDLPAIDINAHTLSDEMKLWTCGFKRLGGREM
jgi:hypothetical protein